MAVIPLNESPPNKKKFKNCLTSCVFGRTLTPPNVFFGVGLEKLIQQVDVL